MKKNVFFGMVFIAIAGILWGAMGSAVQYLFSLNVGFDPLRLVTLRQISAGVLFVAFGTVLLGRKMWNFFARPRDAFDVLVSGLLIFGAHYTFFEAIYYSNAGTAAILLTLVPLICAVWIAVREQRAPRLVETVCFLLASAGVSLIVTDGDFSSLKFSALSLVWGLASAGFAAAYCLQPLAVISRIGVTPVVAWGIFFGGVAASCMCAPWRIEIAWSLPVSGAFAFVVIFGTVAAFWLYLRGLKWVSPVVAGLLNCMEPLSAFLFSILLLSDTLGWWQSLGVALVLSNVCLLALTRRKF